MEEIYNLDNTEFKSYFKEDPKLKVSREIELEEYVPSAIKIHNQGEIDDLSDKMN